MRAIPITLCLIGLLAAKPAQGQQADAGAGPMGLIDRVTSIRMALARIDDAHREVVTQRDRLSRQHEALASEIKSLKSDRDRVQLLPEFGLQQRLRRNQELSESLTLLNRELDALKKARRDRLEQLVLTYDQLVDKTAKRVRATDGQRKADLMAVLLKARQERELVRKRLMPGGQAPRIMDTSGLLASEDPDELDERADAVRDEQDRLRKELARLDHRIQELEAESRLDREMRDFIVDQQIFDEGSRILVSPRTGPATTEGSSDRAVDGKWTSGGDDQGEPNGQVPGGECVAGFCGTPDESGGGALDSDGALGDYSEPGPEAEAPTPPLELTQDGRQPIGVDRSDGEASGPGSAESLQTTKKHRAAIVERIKRLQVLHDRLQEKIESFSTE